MIIVVMAGTRENFYDELKRYIKSDILGKERAIESEETDNDMFYFEHFPLCFGTNRQKQETKIIQNGKIYSFYKKYGLQILKYDFI